MAVRRLSSLILVVLLLQVVPLVLFQDTSLGAVADSELAPPPPGMVQILRTSDGSTLIGRITKVEDNRVTFATDLTVIEIPIDSIVELSEASESSVKSGRYWFPDPAAAQLFLFPTARMVPRGEGYVADYYIFFAAAGYGVSDWLTLGGGLSLFPFVDLDHQIYYFTPKVGIEASENFHLSAGALVIKIPGFCDDDNVPLVGVLDAVATYGGPDRSLTAGVGYGFVEDEPADKPLVLLGGNWRVSRRVAFVSENWVIPGVDNAMISYGVRLMGESISVDLAFFTPTGEDFVFPGVPFVAFAFNF